MDNIETANLESYIVQIDALIQAGDKSSIEKAGDLIQFHSIEFGVKDLIVDDLTAIFKTKEKLKFRIVILWMLGALLGKVRDQASRIRSVSAFLAAAADVLAGKPTLMQEFAVFDAASRAALSTSAFGNEELLDFLRKHRSRLCEHTESMPVWLIHYIFTVELDESRYGSYRDGTRTSRISMF